MPTRTDILIAKHLLDQHDAAVADVVLAYDAFTAATDATKAPSAAAEAAFLKAAAMVTDEADQPGFQPLAGADAREDAQAAIAAAQAAQDAVNTAVTIAENKLEALNGAKAHAQRTAEAIERHYKACGIT